MTRSIVLATVAAFGFALPASVANAGELNAHSAELSNAAAAHQAQLVLASQGYVNVAISGRDDDGRWTGTAWKDGKTVLVAVALPKPEGPVVTN